MIFATKLDLFSIGTTTIPTHIEPIPKPVYIPNIIMGEPIIKQIIVQVNVLVMKLIVPPNIVKQNLFKFFFHP